ncbi:TolC family protein [Clostridiaceae bacterium 35-E11]
MKKIIKGITPIVLVLILNIPIVNADDMIGIIDEKNTHEIQLVIDKVKSDGLEYQENEEAGLLTYEEAIEKALNHSYEFKTQLEEIEKLKILRSEAGDAMGGSYPSGTGNGEDDAARLNRLKKLKSAVNSLTIAEKQREIMKENIGFEVKNAISEINQRLNERELMNLELQNAKIKLEMARAKERKGLLSKYDLEKEEDTYHKQIKEKEMLEKTIETAYTKLNSLIGFGEGEAYSLEDTTQYEPLENKDVDHLVIKVINESPTIWNQEKKIEMAELDLSLYVYNAGGDPYEVKKIDLRQEKYNLANLKLSLEEFTKTIYQQIQQLEKSYELLEANLKSAERNLELVRAKYDAGMTTDMQMIEEELAVEQIKHEMKKKAMEHAKSKELLYNPHLTGK